LTQPSPHIACLDIIADEPLEPTPENETSPSSQFQPRSWGQWGIQPKQSR